MDVMRPERGDLSRAHVMWAGPEYGGEEARRLKVVCGRRCDDYTLQAMY